MEPLTTTASVIALPLAAIPAAIAIHDKLNRFRPRRHIEIWRQRMEEVTDLVDEKEQIIPPAVMEVFLVLIERYKKARSQYQKEILRGSNTWLPFTNGRKVSKNFSHAARNAWQKGTEVSSFALMLQEMCTLYHKDIPKSPEGRCPECVPEELTVLQRNGQYFTKAERLATWSELVDSVRSIIDQEPADDQGNETGGTAMPNNSTRPGLTDEPPVYSGPMGSLTTTAETSAGPSEFSPQEACESTEDITAQIIWDIISDSTELIAQRQADSPVDNTSPELNFNPWASLASLRRVICKKTK